MKNTTRYFESIRDFRELVKILNEKFDPEFLRLEKYKNSAGYSEDVARLTADRESLLNEAREAAMKEVDAACDGMEKAYLSRPASAPSDEQLRLLQALQMREKLTRDDIQTASNSLKDCPTAMAVLLDLAHKNGLVWGMEAELSGTEIQRCIQSLRRNAETLIARLERPGGREKITLDTPTSLDQYALFGLDVDLIDEADCLRRFGHVYNYENFAKMVNAA